MKVNCKVENRNYTEEEKITRQTVQVFTVCPKKNDRISGMKLIVCAAHLGKKKSFTKLCACEIQFEEAQQKNETEKKNK